MPFPFPGDPPGPGIQPISPALTGRFLPTSATWKEKSGMEEWRHVKRIKGDPLYDDNEIFGGGLATGHRCKNIMYT